MTSIEMISNVIEIEDSDALPDRCVTVRIEDAVIQVIDAVTAAEIPYMLVASFSSNFYGIPRSTKDREDISGVIGVQSELLDWDYIYRWADGHDTRAALDEIRASIAGI